MSVVGSALKIALLLAATDNASPVIGRALTNAQKHIRSLTETQDRLDNISNRYMIAGTAITAFYGKAFEASEQAEKANKRLEASFEPIGEKMAQSLLEQKKIAQNNFAETAKQISATFADQGKALAESWSVNIGVNAEDIEATEARFAPFERMFTNGAQQAKLFERATKLAYNMAATGFGNAADNAQKLGMFLNDPLANINKMSRILGRVTPQQKAVIENLYRQKKYTEAQAYALSMVENKFGNTAETMATATDKQKVAMHNLMVTLGDEAAPAINKFLGLAIKLLSWATNFAKAHPALVKAVGVIGVGLVGLGGAFRIASLAIAPFITIFRVINFFKSAKVVAEIAKISTAWKTFKFNILEGSAQVKDAIVKGVGALKTYSKAALNAMQTAAKATWSAIQTGVKAVGNAMASAARFLMANPIILIIAAIAVAAFLIWKNWDKVKAWLIKMWDVLKNVFSKAWDFIKKLFFNYYPLGIIISHWGQIITWFKDMWNKVKNIFNGFITWVETLPQRMLHVGEALLANLWQGITNKVAWLLGKVKGVVQKIRNFFPFSPAKEGPLKDLHKVKIMETVAMSLRPQALYSALGRALNPIGSMAAGGLNNYRSSQSVVFSPVINITGGASKEDAKLIVDTLKKEFPKFMQQYQAKQSRIGFH